LPWQDWQSALLCQPLPNQKDKVDPQLRETLVALIKKYNDAFNKNDAAALAALFTEDAIFVSDRGPVNGRQAIEKFWADEFKQFHHSNEIVTVDENSRHVIGTAGNETGLWFWG
jgi:ketosteroid isomerase-like protein